MTDHATILLAEDDVNEAFLVRRALAKTGLGHRLIHVTDGRECVKYLSGKDPFDDRSKYPLPNLLLLDLKMPTISGLEVLGWMEDQPQLKELPVIILSGSLHENDRAEAAAKGAADFQVKPVEFDELVKVMQALNARWLARG